MSSLVRVSDGLLSFTMLKKKIRSIQMIPERNQQSLDGTCLMLYILNQNYFTRINRSLYVILLLILLSIYIKMGLFEQKLINQMILFRTKTAVAKIRLLVDNYSPLFSSKNIKRHKDKFNIDYEYFSNIPPNLRDDELQRIAMLKNIKQQFNKQIPQFPVKEYWNYHGLKLMTHLWQPTHVKPRAVLVFLHSLNGHIGMFGELARQLASSGIIVTGYDFKNFGQSQGEDRGLLESFEDLVTISEQFVIKIKNKYTNLKIYMCGMSLGGAVAFNLSLKNSNLVDGNIFLSPSIRQNKMHYPFIKKISILLSFLFPRQQLLTSKGKNASKYLLDDYSSKKPYVYQGRLWAKTVQQMLFAMAKTKKQYKNYSVPYLLIQSGSDKLVDPFACLDLQSQCSISDKTTVIIQDMWHAVLFDDRINDVIKIIDEWLDERV